MTATESLWEGTSPTTAYPPIEGRSTADVAVIGGGITGLTTAYLLAKQGLNVTVLEARAIATGTTGHTTAKVTALHGLTYADLIKRHGARKAGLYAQANVAAVERIASIVQQEDIACDFRSLTAYTFAFSEDRLGEIHEEVDAANGLGFRTRFDPAPPLPFATAGAIALDNQVLFHPRKYCIALAGAITDAGGRIHEQSRVDSIETNGDLLSVGTATGVVDARWVVQATLLPINDPAGLFARTEPSRSYAVAARVDDPEPWGMFLSVEMPHRSIRPHQLDTGEAYLVIEGDEHRTGEDATADEHFGALEDWARSHMPALNEFQYRWSAQDYMPADGIPYVGRLAHSSERMLVATGFKKWGMSNGTAAAMMLSDLILGRENAWLEAFDATRLGLPQGLGEMVKSNVDVARQFIGARLASVPGVSDLGPGTGSIVAYEGKRLAVYRNEQGNLNALSARCTHMGCLVAFNPAERSWDCPCHGSRFALDGQVLEGPAVTPLEPVDVSETPG